MDRDKALSNAFVWGGIKRPFVLSPAPAYTGTGKLETGEIKGTWCGWRDLNSHGLIAHMDLNHARLPIPPQPRSVLIQAIVECGAADRT